MRRKSDDGTPFELVCKYDIHFAFHSLEIVINLKGNTPYASENSHEPSATSFQEIIFDFEAKRRANLGSSYCLAFPNANGAILRGIMEFHKRRKGSRKIFYE